MKILLNTIPTELDSSGAIFLPQQQTLVIADVHLGKIEHFRKHGSAVPAILSAKNYIELDRVIQKYQPQTLLFLGDLFHSEKNKDWERFIAWVRRNQSLQLQLIIGNHDIIAQTDIESLGIITSTEVIIDQLRLTHHPEVAEGYFNICGHIHPGFHLKGEAKQSLKLPCFYQKKQQLMLPAFGTFTGKHLISPEEGEHVYVIAEQNVIKIL